MDFLCFCFGLKFILHLFVLCVCVHVHMYDSACMELRDQFEEVCSLLPLYGFWRLNLRLCGNNLNSPSHFTLNHVFWFILVFLRIYFILVIYLNYIYLYFIEYIILCISFLYNLSGHVFI